MSREMTLPVLVKVAVRGDNALQLEEVRYEQFCKSHVTDDGQAPGTNFCDINHFIE